MARTDETAVLEAGVRDLSVPNPTASQLAALSTKQIMDLAAEASCRMAAITGLLLQLAGELDRREGWRAEGATSLENWLVQRCGVSSATARGWAQVAGRLFDLPVLAQAFAAGDLSFDKVRRAAEVATPETEAEVCEVAKESSVRELLQLEKARAGKSPEAAHAEYEGRSVRFNDAFRTVTAQLPEESYAEVRTCLESRAKDVPSDGETSWDQRVADAFMQVFRTGSVGAVEPATTGTRSATGRGDARARAAGAADRGAGSRAVAGGGAAGAGAGSSGRPFLVVAHAPLDVLLDEDGEPSELCGELERGGLLSVDTVRRVACDASIVVAVDDDVGHTVYEGRARRFPTGTQRREIMRRDRHCRFPGCANVTFTDVHHVKPWVAARGRTDLDNLVLLCEYHHHQVHSRSWTMSGDANEELIFVGPSGQPQRSRPSPLWTTPKR
jgi:Domain of unknown function (DUF222)/HNH endonuclease